MFIHYPAILSKSLPYSSKPGYSFHALTKKRKNGRKKETNWTKIPVTGLSSLNPEASRTQDAKEQVAQSDSILLTNTLTN